MEAAEYVRMAEVQDRHWWFEAKRRTVASLLERHGVGKGVHGVSRVLEVGPGTGSMIDVMTRHGRMYAADAYVPALRLLVEQRPTAADVEPVAANLLDLPFADESFSLLGCFDVLYHQNVVDVAAALAELRRVCAPGGYVAITDSAFPLLRSSHDVATHAARRFRLPDLTEPLRAVGFDVEHASYFHTLLFPAAVTVRLAKRLSQGSPQLEGMPGGGTGAAGAAGVSSPARTASAVGDAASAGAAGEEEVAAHSDLAPVAGWLNALLLSLYRLEIPFTTRWRAPFGSSLLILARRPHAGADLVAVGG